MEVIWNFGLEKLLSYVGGLGLTCEISTESLKTISGCLLFSFKILSFWKAEAEESAVVNKLTEVLQ